jgi:hypothetical protein
MRRGFAVLLLAATAFAGDGPKIQYSKYFKGSVPEYVGITLERSGQVTYKESADDDRPLQFQLTPAQTAEIFDLADKLDRFKRPLESPAKVANMGMKTFIYEDGSAKNEVKFNFTEDANARVLNDWFERITESEQNYYNLERTVKFDHLGVNEVLLQIQIALEKNRLIAPQQFLPLLDRVSKNENYMHMSRERAAKLAEVFRNHPDEKAGK